MGDFFSAPNGYNGSTLKYRKENGTYYRIDTYFNGMFVVFYDNVPKKLIVSPKVCLKNLR